VSDSRHDDGGRQEFLSEAQELLEVLAKDLLSLDEGVRRGDVRPDTLNDLFRGVHTLKGLAGMFGMPHLSRLAHLMEDLMEDLRLGRLQVNTQTLDVLFEGADGLQRMLADATQDPEGSVVDLDAFAARVKSVASVDRVKHDVLSEYEIEPGMLSVLTEYEEHRLRTNLQQGTHVYRVRLEIPLEVIDTALEQLKQRLSASAEIITYLPSMDPSTNDAIVIEMLVASRESESLLVNQLQRPDATITRIRHRGVSPSVRAALAPSVRPAERASVRPTHAPPMSAQLAVDDEPEQAASLRSLTSFVRVDIRKLDHLMNVIGELGMVRNALGKIVDRLRARSDGRQLATELHRVQRLFERYLAEAQDGVLDVRMVPLAQLFDKVAVIVRQVAREQGKEVRLLVSGSETEVDKLIAEELADPLMHLIRNAIDHGIETPDERARIGKPRGGSVTIDAYHKGNHVVIELSDDGRGIDPGLLIEHALRRGILSEEVIDGMTPAEAMNVIFLPGFSTREEVTNLSGRGVGMDVVKTNITRIGGAVEVSSEVMVGTKITLTLPVTLAITRALLFEVSGQLMSIPLAVVQEALRVEASEIRRVESREVVSIRGETLPLCRLSDLFGFGAGARPGGGRFVIVLNVGHRRLGLIVDSLKGQQDVVIKAFGPSLKGLTGVAGATDLGDQQLVLVLDGVALLDEVLAGRALPRLQEQAR
jgi:two-component system chemotaxis sensor kinase CheA